MGGPVVMENRFAAPPEWVAAWLTDFRPEDRGRWYGEKKNIETIRREGNRIHLRGRLPLGPYETVVTLESPLRWTARVEVGPPGHLLFVTGIVEEVRADGAGTFHRATLTPVPQRFLGRLLLPLLVPPMRRGLRKAFDRMALEIELAYRAGLPPTA